MSKDLKKLSRSKYRPSAIDISWIIFVIFGLAMGLAGKPKSEFYGVAFGALIFTLRLIGINRSLIFWLTGMSLFQLVGETAGFYGSVPNFDRLVHTLFPIIGSLVAYAVLVRLGLVPRPRGFNDRHPGATLGIIVFFIAVTGGAVWEMLEFTSDVFHLFPQMLQYGNVDTMGDIVCAGIGGLIAAFIAPRIWPSK